MTLHRPVGPKKLELIAESGWREFPPRLYWQPIFYPVMTHDYACPICVDWNAKDADSGHCGFVTQFEVEDDFVARYPVQEAGGRSCRELWVPTEEMAEFNRHIVGQIKVIESVYGPGFIGDIDAATQLPAGLAASAPRAV